MVDARKLMPLYRSHKVVRASKITDIEESSVSRDTLAGRFFITLENPRGYQVLVSGDWVRKHEPKVGGYFVVYADGYESWSPAEAFEDGYTLETAKGSWSATGTGGGGND